ncbi:hypothetical protein POM88_032243 [Heracleum sosnowskyi]|uniref:Uncharacterized protein n=1 Tax=Heracleum sosnowskyi TaxID=360622 RepID=A0AAD8MHC7_9APIA|nr:hypothetical protein POM88_032243 [Heracleum sosnowskyi]
MKRNSFVYIFKLFQLTIMALIIGVWVFLTYYVIGFDPNVGRLFKQYLILLLINQMASALFRMTGALGRNMILANTFGGFALLILFALGGFVLARGDVPNWWIWGYYISPMMYGMNAIAVNEFLGHQWSRLNTDGSETIGVALLKSRGFFPYSYWYWIGAGALIGFILILNVGYTLALAYLHPLGKPQAIVPAGSNAAEVEESTAENNEKKKKGMILPFQPHSITFDDIKYSVDMPQEMKEQGVVENKLLLLKGNDIHSPYVTVHESLLYSAWLRLPSEVDTAKRKMFVNEVLELVELDNIKEALVGLPGRTVVCTIHQPSIDIFEAFDELFLMKRGGMEIYAGPVGQHSCELIQYLEDIDGVSKIKEGYNPATWMLEVTASSQEMILGIDFTDIYKHSDLYRRNKSLIQELSTPRPGSKMDTRQDLFNAMGSMYAACLFLGIQNASSVQPVVAVERTVFYRERAAGMYSALPYAFAQVLVEIPYIFCQAVTYGLIGLLSHDLVYPSGGDVTFAFSIKSFNFQRR